MTKTLGFTVACFLGIAAIGCSPKAGDTTNQVSSAGSDNSPLKAVSTDNAPASHDSNNASQDKPKEPAMDLGKIPASLKGAAFDYYGLGRTEPVKMKVVKNGNDDGTGTQTVTLSKVGADYAEFTVSTSGALAIMGEAVLRLDKSGIKVLSLNGKSPGSDNYELPSDVTVGKSWPFKLDNDQLKISGTNKISGTESVKTPVGTYKDAIVVSVTASGKQGAESVKLSSKTWLVKGRGQVKTEITNVSGQTKQTITMEEAK